MSTLSNGVGISEVLQGATVVAPIHPATRPRKGGAPIVLAGTTGLRSRIIKMPGTHLQNSGRSHKSAKQCRAPFCTATAANLIERVLPPQRGLRQRVWLPSVSQDRQ